MTVEVIHVKPDHDGHTRIKLAERFSGTVRCTVPDLVYEEDSPWEERKVNDVVVQKRHRKGDPVEEVTLTFPFPGKDDFLVLSGTTALDFDGQTVDISKGA